MSHCGLQTDWLEHMRGNFLEKLRNSRRQSKKSEAHQLSSHVFNGNRSLGLKRIAPNRSFRTMGCSIQPFCSLGLLLESLMRAHACVSLSIAISRKRSKYVSFVDVMLVRKPSFL